VLWPMDERTRALANQWMDWAFSFQGSVRDAFWNLIRTPANQRDAKAVEASRLKSGEMARILDTALADRLYVAGPFSMGDIPIGSEVQRWIRLPMERPKLPNLEAWFERLCARTAFKKIVDIPLS
jgi:glutathione S-transferase